MTPDVTDVKGLMCNTYGDLLAYNGIYDTYICFYLDEVTENK